ncbi:hypothetical protein DFH08DRAFT_1079954 [Mycena albidolilacea]|uniref:Uncharacterized protein n=1 Tax=Mycena albidolilacea TaxID=1033008 RepID=A0AAD7ETT8_9AGAR|nr:hypothetical protein DFH08DRAFT_1079954 [Mycena albidolilacea]
MEEDGYKTIQYPGPKIHDKIYPCSAHLVSHLSLYLILACTIGACLHRALPRGRLACILRLGDALRVSGAVRLFYTSGVKLVLASLTEDGEGAGDVVLDIELSRAPRFVGRLFWVVVGAYPSPASLRLFVLASCIRTCTSPHLRTACPHTAGALPSSTAYAKDSAPDNTHGARRRTSPFILRVHLVPAPPPLGLHGADGAEAGTLDGRMRAPLPALACPPPPLDVGCTRGRLRRSPIGAPRSNPSPGRVPQRPIAPALILRPHPPIHLPLLQSPPTAPATFLALCPAVGYTFRWDHAWIALAVKRDASDLIPLCLASPSPVDRRDERRDSG